MRRKKTYDMPPSFGIESDLQRNFMVCVVRQLLCWNFYEIDAKLYRIVARFLHAPKQVMVRIIDYTEPQLERKKEGTVLNMLDAPFPSPPAQSLISERCLLIFSMMPECMILVRCATHAAVTGSGRIWRMVRSILQPKISICRSAHGACAMTVCVRG